MKQYTINGNEITTRDAGAVINTDAGKLFLVSINSTYGARVYVLILPGFEKPFHIYYSGGGTWPDQFRAAYKTPGGAARYIEKAVAQWGNDVAEKEYLPENEIAEIMTLPSWEFDYSLSPFYN